MPERDDAPASPAPWVRRLVTAVIALHFFAILTTLVGTGNRRFPPPDIAVWFRRTKPVEAYLQSTFLTSPHRYYAPDPGPTTLMWFEVEYADGAIRWVELAERDDFRVRTSYQRHMSLPLLLDWSSLYPDPTDSQKMSFTEEGRACTSSYVRHVALSNPRVGANGARIPVRSVTTYFAYHQVLQPFQIRMNWGPDDLRLYSQTYLGVYSASGDRSKIDVGDGAYVVPSHTYVLAEFMLHHMAPLLDGVPEQERLGKTESLNLPAPWQRVLKRYPELLKDLPTIGTADDPKTVRARITELEQTIQAKIASQDTPTVEAPPPKANVTP